MGSASAEPWDFTAAVEGGLDSFAQRFQITDDLGTDLLGGQRAFRDTTEVFTELRGVGELALGYRQANHRFLARGRVSVGTDLIRESLRLDLRLRSRESPHRLDAKVDVEGRQFRDDSDFSLSSDVFQTTARAHYRRRLSDSIDLGLKGKGEIRAYQEPGTFEFNQTRGDLSLTSSVVRGFTFSLDLEGGGGARDVPDTTEISFTRGFANLDLNWTPGLDWSANVHGGLERRVYNDVTVRSPFVATILEPSVTWRIDDAWSVRASSANEWLSYDTPTPVYFDFWLGWAGLAARRSWGALEAALEPRWSWLNANAQAEDRYQQPSVVARVEWFPSSRLWLSWSEEVGYRDYGEVATGSLGLYSDYSFVRSTVLLSWQLQEPLRADFFLSDEPENHRDASDDGRLTLVTASLRLTL